MLKSIGLVIGLNPPPVEAGNKLCPVHWDAGKPSSLCLSFHSCLHWLWKGVVAAACLLQ